ncbi:demethylmenaquinone methyltransferase [Opitutia bacterium]|jgi:ArsR family transcriptional regulator|nr:metalloregulator ArsR/SmtB family transcription factor [bacterium]GBL23823.1 demethylmenaquinone methyltransferase [Opitutae bacterium]
MSDPWETLRLLADPTRSRILHLLHRGELAVGELQEILGLPQSRISTHLALLRKAQLVNDRRDGKKSFYSLARDLPVSIAGIVDAALAASARESKSAADQRSLQRIIEKRRQKAEQHFNLVADRLGRNYCPGRSWEAIGQMLFLLTPRVRIADLGAGDGTLSRLLARQAESVHCVDNSPRMVQVGRALAKKEHLRNLTYILGNIEKVPLPDRSIDLALLSQALHHAENPRLALSEAFRILKPGGRLLILDLRAHRFEKARELYADRWLGFKENELHDWIEEAGFRQSEVRVVAKEVKEPCFETILATGMKPGG